MSLGAIAFFVAFAAYFGGVFWLFMRDSRRRKRRRESLSRDGDGSYAWVDFDGTPRRSDRHPEKEGGEWFNQPGGAGYSGGDGGDSGGGGD